MKKIIFLASFLLFLTSFCFATDEGQGKGNIYGTQNTVIDANGNIGIGITSPQRMLHVQGNNAIWRLDRDTNSAALQIHRFPTGNFTTPWKGFLIGVNAIGVNDGQFFIGDYNTSTSGIYTTRLTIDTYGNVGISTATPTERLDVSGMVVSSGCYAGIYVNDGSTTTIQAIPTGVTYSTITAFTDDGLSANCTADSTNDKITITKTGVYKVNGTFSLGCQTNNVIFRGAAFLDNVEQNQVHFARKIATAGDLGSASFSGYIDVTSVPLDLDFRVRHDNAGSVNIYFAYSNLNIEYAGKT